MTPTVLARGHSESDERMVYPLLFLRLKTKRRQKVEHISVQISTSIKSINNEKPQHYRPLFVSLETEVLHILYIIKSTCLIHKSLIVPK